MEENKNPRRGRLCYVQSTCASSKGLQALIHHSFSHNGVRLFNCAPRHIRNLTGVTTDTFKHHLDKWLADIPDQPPTPGYSSSHDNTLPSVVLEARNSTYYTWNEWRTTSTPPITGKILQRYQSLHVYLSDLTSLDRTVPWQQWCHLLNHDLTVTARQQTHGYYQPISIDGVKMPNLHLLKGGAPSAF
ncbi:hypothetical protein GWK47_008624 [Chionoecetes opilio]|uniref:Uncharacterized protein n=1 Tax=Chionoecetes opilio TaxID=41210 RepID=A0A8J5CR74_CHIOP|nr:hypothetical protein GWK47_008624 [Chionoecetes opilio]